VLDPHGLLDGAAEGEPVTVQAEASWEAPSRWMGRAAALGMLLLSGALGLAAFRLGASSPLGIPASPLLPLLAGLFALPGLVRALLRPAPAARTRLRAPRPARGELLKGAGPGAAVSSLLGLAPGVSASHVALLLPQPRTPERALLRIAAINGGAVAFTLLAWHALGKARSGALVAAEAMAAPAPWPAWAPTPSILEEAALVLGAATLACLLARAASGPVARLVAAGGGRALSLAGVATLLAAVALFNGALGLAELAVAGLVGETVARVGVRRGLAMGVILLPAMARAWEWA
jgi:TctA family transporter